LVQVIPRQLNRCVPHCVPQLRASCSQPRSAAAGGAHAAPVPPVTSFRGVCRGGEQRAAARSWGCPRCTCHCTWGCATEKWSRETPRAAACALGGEKRDHLGRASLPLGLTWRAVCLEAFRKGRGKEEGTWLVCVCTFAGFLRPCLVVLNLPIYGGVAPFPVRLAWHCWGENWQSGDAPSGCLSSSWGSPRRSATRPGISGVWCPAVSQRGDWTWPLLAELLLLRAREGKGGVIADSEGGTIQVHRWRNVLTSSVYVFVVPGW